jgi:hypothetical protein
LLGPGREAAVDQLKLGSCHIRGVDVEAGPNVIPATGLPLGVKFAEDARVVDHQRPEYLSVEGFLPPTLFKISERDPQPVGLVAKSGDLTQQPQVKGDLFD